MLAVIALALTATAVYAGPELVQSAPSLRAQSWNLDIAARRPPMRAQVSQALKTRTPVAKQICAALPQVGFALHLRAAGSSSQLVSQSPLRRGRSFTSSRAPPIV
jgi:hypothetical protein